VLHASILNNIWASSAASELQLLASQRHFLIPLNPLKPPCLARLLAWYSGGTIARLTIVKLTGGPNDQVYGCNRRHFDAGFDTITEDHILNTTYFHCVLNAKEVKIESEFTCRTDPYSNPTKKRVRLSGQT
jgi:hypothetical protein